MKTINAFILLIILLSFGCENIENDKITDPKEGICLKIADSIVYNHSQIDFYDFSSHLIYLKNGNSFSYCKSSMFDVFADNQKIYTGQLLPLYSSYLPAGPVINCAPAFYWNYIIPIGFIQIIDPSGNSNPDPRDDIKIIEALKKFNQYREGLHCEIISVQKTSSTSVRVDLRLTNNDSFKIHYLDPNKMGINLFHYFTNGLLLRNSANKTFTHLLTPTRPEPWNTWKKDWLSPINSKESKIISIKYNSFETIPPGQYIAYFGFPGLTYQVEKKDIIQDNGRIWLGELRISKMALIE